MEKKIHIIITKIKQNYTYRLSYSICASCDIFLVSLICMCVGILVVSIWYKRFLISQWELYGWFLEGPRLGRFMRPLLNFERPQARASQGPKDVASQFQRTGNEKSIYKWNRIDPLSSEIFLSENLCETMMYTYGIFSYDCVYKMGQGSMIWLF